MKKKIVISLLAACLLIFGCGNKTANEPEVTEAAEETAEETAEEQPEEEEDSSEQEEDRSEQEEAEISEEENAETEDETKAEAGDMKEDAAVDKQEDNKEGSEKQDKLPAVEEKSQAAAGNPSSAGIGSVTISGTKIVPGEDFAAKAGALGSPSGYQESANCMGLGMDKIYTYGSTKVYTQPDGTTDILFLIELNGSDKTSGGIGCGNTIDEIKAACGSPQADDGSMLSYTAGGVSVDFYYSGNTVTMVELY